MPKVQMQIEFYKYQGAGNDFIIIDDRKNNFSTNNVLLIKQLCDRRFGIGADGLMLLQEEEDFDFRMVYYNSDGNESTMCGNGGRCITHFANHLKIIKKETKFIAIDGEHLAQIQEGLVNLQMIDVNNIERVNSDYWLDTGSPHYIQFVEKLDSIDVFNSGKKIRNSEKFIKEGTNVNFVEELRNGEIAIRTYERGVENETLACGTGVTAAAIVYGMRKSLSQIKVKAQGGNLEVKFNQFDNSFQDVWLKGPSEFVFKGTVQI